MFLLSNQNVLHFDLVVRGLSPFVNANMLTYELQQLQTFDNDNRGQTHVIIILVFGKDYK